MAQTAKKTGSKNTAKDKKKNTVSPQAHEQALIRDFPWRKFFGFVCLFFGLLSLIGLFTAEGWFVKIFSGFIKGLLGYGYYLVPPALFLCAFLFFSPKEKPIALRVFSALMLPVVLGAFIHTIVNPDIALFGRGGAVSQLYTGGSVVRCGGVISGSVAMFLRSSLSVYGAVPILAVCLLLFVMVSLNITAGKLSAWIGKGRKLYDEKRDAISQNRTLQPENSGDDFDIPVAEKKKSRLPPVFTDSYPGIEDDELTESSDAVKPKTDMPEKDDSDVFDALSREIFSVQPPEEKPPEKASKAEIQELSDDIAAAIESEAEEPAEEYLYPSSSLLRTNTSAPIDGREETAANRERLNSTLHSFGVNAAIKSVTRGPTITRYDLELEAGVKLNKITNLAGDLALSLGVASVRISPIPDKIATVGVEVPNKIVNMVYLRDIIDSPAFRGASSKLTFAIGEDIGGESVCGNIQKLPHMLIAGTTGSGKSVCMNCLILSLLYKATPEEVRLIMIDPKMVELGAYNGIPHLYIPVVTDPKKAAGSLQWAVVEMLKRYRLFSEIGVRDIAGYNMYQKNNGGQTIPQVVIVIDELADLMLVASKEVEESICRVAQMGRASGMHLIIATQRPSADVITGLMKANIPSRIAFAVSSSLESRIILDTQGAEKLIGAGDMLYAPIGSGKPRRIQGAFVSDDERQNVIDFVKSQSAAQYSSEIMEQIEKAAETKSSGSKQKTSAPENDENIYDELVSQAANVIFETKQASTSMLQRRLKLGYARAARIVDQLEELGLVGPNEGSKPRQILISKDEWEASMNHSSAPAPEEDADNIDVPF